MSVDTMTNPEPSFVDVQGAVVDDPLGVFAGRVNMRLLEAFRAIGVSRSHGYNLIDRGILDRRKMGRSSVIAVASLVKVAVEGVPPAKGAQFPRRKLRRWHRPKNPVKRSLPRPEKARISQNV